MDARAWAVAILYGLLVGFLLGRFREEQRVTLGALLVASALGMVVWLVTPDSVAGPSLAVGCGLGFVAMFLTRRKARA